MIIMYYCIKQASCGDIQVAVISQFDTFYILNDTILYSQYDTFSHWILVHVLIRYLYLVLNIE